MLTHFTSISGAKVLLYRVSLQNSQKVTQIDLCVGIHVDDIVEADPQEPCTLLD